MSARPQTTKKKIVPSLASLHELPQELGTVDTLLVDAGYYNEDNAARCEQSEIEPYIPPQRDKHNKSLAEWFSKPAPLL